MNRPYGVLSKQEGVIKGETRSCPFEITSARSADKHVSAETCAIENPTTACVGTLRKHAGGMFLVPTAAAMPRGGNREGRGTGGAEPRPYGSTLVRRGRGATFMIAARRGGEILHCAQNDRTLKRIRKPGGG